MLITSSNFHFLTDLPQPLESLNDIIVQEANLKDDILDVRKINNKNTKITKIFFHFLQSTSINDCKFIIKKVFHQVREW